MQDEITRNLNYLRFKMLDNLEKDTAFDEPNRRRIMRVLDDTVKQIEKERGII